MPATLTPELDPSRARIGVRLTGFPDIDVIVYRVAGGVRRVVRAGNPVRPLGGTALVFDYEAPLGGVLSRYEATDASTGAVVSATGSLETTQTWVKSPSQPALNTAVTFVDVPSMQAPRRQQVFDVLGRSDPIVASDARSSLRGQLQWRSMAAEETDRILGLLRGSPVVFLQVPATPFGERYASLGDADVASLFDFQGPVAAVWTVAYVEVAFPPGGQVGDLNSYQAVRDAYPTYAALQAGEANYLDLLRGAGTQ